jgi:hypothetical protein
MTPRPCRRMTKHKLADPPMLVYIQLSCPQYLLEDADEVVIHRAEIQFSINIPHVDAS